MPETIPSGSTTRGASAAGVNAAPALGASSSFLGAAGAAPRQFHLGTAVDHSPGRRSGARGSP